MSIAAAAVWLFSGLAWRSRDIYPETILVPSGMGADFPAVDLSALFT